MAFCAAQPFGHVGIGLFGTNAPDSDAWSRPHTPDGANIGVRGGTIFYNNFKVIGPVQCLPAK